MSKIDSGDILNPLGGVINYIDENGNPQVESGLFSPNTVQILASSIISTFGVEPINCGP